MDNKGYKIGEVSKLLGISVQAIRHYQKQGLIEPCFIDNNGYRYFDNNAIGDLFTIGILKSAGFSLKQIKETENKDITEMKQLFMQYKLKTQKLIMQKQATLSYINRRLEAIAMFEKDGYVAHYKHIPKRMGFGIKANKITDTYHHFQLLLNIKGMYGLHQEVAHQPSRFLTLDNNEFKLHKFVAIYQNNCLNSENDFEIAGGLYCCKVVKGYDNLHTEYDNLIEDIKRDGYELRGDATEIILIDGSLAKSSRDITREVQIAVIDR